MQMATREYDLYIELKDNPIPYKRTTQRAKFVSKDYLKYLEFKKHLQMEFLRQNKVQCFKAFDEKKFYSIELKIGFKNKKHGDCDNILKGVLDALFKNDKNVIKGEYELKSFEKSFLKVKISEFKGVENV
ncbi:TPA: hypothetical protein RTF98_001296 [Campylobacter jejuni]|nr:hypothetical protein [Campylobacter jejuni]HDZ4937454.1 hypothetical protein [Campylobacter jejuni]HDZ4940866.1 hypothetical protein [Campylobacter jejuni]HDZ4944025.1 hypothetical protein [Campylobacter jejuni]HDZ4946024.1 hypothetical protein [Campylobacter jejuni]